MRFKKGDIIKFLGLGNWEDRYVFTIYLRSSNNGRLYHIKLLHKYDTYTYKSFYPDSDFNLGPERCKKSSRDEYIMEMCL